MNGRWMTMTAAALALGAVTSTGCVPKGRFDEAVAASRRCQDELQKSLAALEDARGENRRLMAELGQARSDLTNRDQLMANLTQEKALLDKAYGDLQAAYDRLKGRPLDVKFGMPVLPEKLHEALKALAEQNKELMEYLPEYGMVKLKSDLTFDKGSAEVTPAAADSLKKLAAIINTADAAKFHVYVAGHTDDLPLVNPETIRLHGTNWGLSAHRALMVVKVLAVAGVAQPRLGAMGFSKYHPIAPNQPGNKGNPVNRRVEIWIVPPDRLLTMSGLAAPAAASPEK